jgi:hypothetical protein
LDIAGHTGAALKTPAGKTRIANRLDDDLLQWFRKLPPFRKRMETTSGVCRSRVADVAGM